MAEIIERPVRTEPAGPGGRPMVAAEQLQKRFGDVVAVAGVSFEVGAGETFGFLGPNGAGKSTTINILCTLLRPSGGSARVAGYDVVAEPARVRQHIGLVFQDPTLDTYLTATENLRFHAELYGLDRHAYRTRSRQLLEMVELWDRRDDLVRTFSGGMKRRLEIARGLLHAPRVLFLDEPTLGLDPQTRAHIWTYINELRRAEGVTIFLTTHYLDEAENCDRIAIIEGGRIVVDDTPDALKASIGEDRIELHTPDQDTAARALRAHFGITATASEGALAFHAPQAEVLVPRLVTGLGVPVHSVRVARPTLDDVFMAYTGRTIRDAEASSSERLRDHATRWRR